jgi:hypothetical protein
MQRLTIQQELELATLAAKRLLLLTMERFYLMTCQAGGKRLQSLHPANGCSDCTRKQCLSKPSINYDSAAVANLQGDPAFNKTEHARKGFK